MYGAAPGLNIQSKVLSAAPQERCLHHLTFPFCPGLQSGLEMQGPSAPLPPASSWQHSHFCAMQEPQPRKTAATSLSPSR